MAGSSNSSDLVERIWRDAVRRAEQQQPLDKLPGSCCDICLGTGCWVPGYGAARQLRVSCLVEPTHGFGRLRGKLPVSSMLHMGSLAFGRRLLLRNGVLGLFWEGGLVLGPGLVLEQGLLQEQGLQEQVWRTEALCLAPKQRGPLVKVIFHSFLHPGC